MKDEELRRRLEEIGRGEIEAFEAVYEALSAPLYTVLRRIVRDRTLAEDLLQELFLKLYREPPVRAHRPRAYLFQMAHNLALDALRARREEVPLDEQGAAWPRDDLRLDLERALAQLEPRDAELVTLHVNGGLKFREAAEAMGMPLGTVLWRYRRAIGRLQTLLNGGAL